MEIMLNGKAHEAEAGETIQDLIGRLEIGGRRVAVMINDGIVKKDTYSVTKVREGDRVEVIQMVGGG